MKCVHSHLRVFEFVLALFTRHTLYWLLIEFSGFSYEETAGYCRGGGNWPGLSTAWYCLAEDGTRLTMTEDECQSECDKSADCHAFDRTLADQSECCLFTEGHTGDSRSGRQCFVREDATTTTEPPSMFMHFRPFHKLDCVLLPFESALKCRWANLIEMLCHVAGLSLCR